MKKKKIIIICVLLIIIVFTIIMLFQEEKREYISYANFVDKVNDRQVKSVRIKDKKTLIVFLKPDNNEYITENPGSNTLKEFLLLNGVEIDDSFGEEEFGIVLDSLFYLVFFGAVGYGIYKVVSFNTQTFKIIKKNDTRFENVVGMDSIKKDLMKTVEVLKNPEEYQQKGIRPTKGILLEGPPGNGKTLLARALAGEAKMNFIATKGADFQSAMMSIGPRKIKALFRKARKNKPCIIFIDEFDGIGESRNYAGTGIDKENNRLIITLLNEMDGFSNEEGVLVIAATNSYASLDKALIRPGRFDKKYRIDNPNAEEILALIQMYTKNKKLETKMELNKLAKCFEHFSCSAIETILNEAAMNALMNGREEISKEDLIAAGKKTGMTLKEI